MPFCSRQYCGFRNRFEQLNHQSGQIQVTAGHMVDKEGNIELPIVGIIHVVGMTTFQAKEQIKQKVKDLYKEATVDVRYNNFKITVMGEVLRPATYTIPNEKINLLDALGMVGDMTIYGKRG